MSCGSVNHITSPGRTKWLPPTDIVICNLNYKDFKGPSKESKDLIPVHFKRPSSYNPAVTPAITPPTAFKRKRSAVEEKITKKSKCMSTDEDLNEHVIPLNTTVRMLLMELMVIFQVMMVTSCMMEMVLSQVLLVYILRTWILNQSMHM